MKSTHIALIIHKLCCKINSSSFRGITFIYGCMLTIVPLHLMIIGTAHQPAAFIMLFVGIMLFILFGLSFKKPKE